MQMKKLAAAMGISAVLLNAAGCGVLLHPERQGQTGGQIDMKIALLDGIGLLFFVIPGLVAFAVDFHQGTIYLPGTAGVPGDDSVRSIAIEGDMTEEAIEQAIKTHTGNTVDISADNVKSYEADADQLGQLNMLNTMNIAAARSLRTEG